MANLMGLDYEWLSFKPKNFYWSILTYWNGKFTITLIFYKNFEKNKVSCKITILLISILNLDLIQ
jgi:hypothetical protein